MKPQSFLKIERLLKRSQFEIVMAKGQKCRVENLCTIIYLPNSLPHKRLGIIASKKVGNAVVRNRAKRRIREIFRRNKNLGAPALDLVIISGKKLVDLPFAVLEEKLRSALNSLK